MIMEEAVDSQFLNWLDQQMGTGLTDTVIPSRDQLREEIERTEDPEVLKKARVSSSRSLQA